MPCPDYIRHRHWPDPVVDHPTKFLTAPRRVKWAAAGPGEMSSSLRNTDGANSGSKAQRSLPRYVCVERRGRGKPGQIRCWKRNLHRAKRKTKPGGEDPPPPPWFLKPRLNLYRMSYSSLKDLIHRSRFHFTLPLFPLPSLRGNRSNDVVDTADTKVLECYLAAASRS